MGIWDDIQADLEEQKRQLAADVNKRLKTETAAGKRSYDKNLLDATAKAGGIYVPPPTAMPLQPDMTRAADRQSMARRRRRGRSSTMLTSTLGEETLGG